MKRSRSSLVSALVFTTVGVAAAAVACGGSKSQDGTTTTGQSTNDLDVTDPAEASDAAPPPADAEPPAAPITFVLKNSHSDELAFNLDRGWQTSIQAYTGKPPKAKPILMFATHCTASCETAEDARCPICEEPEKLADIRAAQKLEKVAPDGELEVPWDGQMFVYEKTKGAKSKTNKRRCECYTLQEAPAETYTVRACGLRLTKSAEQSTKLQCVEGQMVLPAEEPIRVELDFGAPSTPGKGKKKGR